MRRPEGRRVLASSMARVALRGTRFLLTGKLSGTQRIGRKTPMAPKTLDFTDISSVKRTGPER